MLNVSIFLAVNVEWWLPVLVKCYDFLPRQSFVPDTPSMHRVSVMQCVGRTKLWIHSPSLSELSKRRKEGLQEVLSSQILIIVFLVFLPVMCLRFVLCALCITQEYASGLKALQDRKTWLVLLRKAVRFFFKAELALKAKYECHTRKV